MDHEDRNAIAAGRGRAAGLLRRITDNQVVVIGDTPLDIAAGGQCARVACRRHRRHSLAEFAPYADWPVTDLGKSGCGFYRGLRNKTRCLMQCGLPMPHMHMNWRPFRGPGIAAAHRRSENGKLFWRASSIRSADKSSRPQWPGTNQISLPSARFHTETHKLAWRNLIAGPPRNLKRRYREFHDRPAVKTALEEAFVWGAWKVSTRWRSPSRPSDFVQMQRSCLTSYQCPGAHRKRDGCGIGPSLFRATRKAGSMT